MSSSWQQQQQRLPRIVAEAGQAESESSTRQMGPPSQSLPSLNFRQLAPLRSPNLPSSMHSNSYFSQQRNRSTSESVANEGLRALRHQHQPPPNLPEPPSTILSSSNRGEVLPPLGAFGRPSSPKALVVGEGGGGGRSAKHLGSQQSSHYHPYQQHPYQTLVQHPSTMYRSPSSNHQTNPPSPGAYYPSLSPRLPHSLASQDRHYYSASGAPHGYDRSLEDSREGSLMEGYESSPRKLAKSHVPSACLNCKRAHLACDVSRPCRRCINLGKTDTCIDVQHKKRGRPRLRDREAAAVAAAAAAAAAVATSAVVAPGAHEYSSGLPSQRMRGSISSSSSTSTMKQSPRSEPTAYLSPTGDSNALFSPSANKAASSMTSLTSRGRSVSSSASLWSQNANAVATKDYASSPPPTAVSLILSTGLQCARCSVESQALLGFAPSDLLERSLFELVHPSEKQRLEQLWLSLIEPVGVKPQVVPANAETVMNLSPAVLMAPAPGTVFMQETMRLRQRSGIFDFYSVRLHLGGGFGADLYQHHTLDRAYIVASLLKLGNDATHPSSTVLRDSRWHSGGDSRYFSTPQTEGSGGGQGGVGTGLGNGLKGGGTNYHGTQAAGSATGHYRSPPPPPPPPSRYDWQRLDNDHKSNGSTDALLHRQYQQHTSEPAPFSRPVIYNEDLRRPNTGPNETLRDSRPRSNNDMDITPPATAKHRSEAVPAMASRPSLSKASVPGPSPSFSYSSRAERGGITA